MCQVLYRDDGAPLGTVVRLEGASLTFAYTTMGALRHLGARPTDEAAKARRRGGDLLSRRYPGIRRYPLTY
jgi:hypothetical protein